MKRRMKTLTFFNHVGGAMKTSLTRDVGHDFAARGLRVLLIDLDPQANLSSASGVSVDDVALTVHDTAVDDAPLPEPFRVHGYDLIPSTVQLALAEARMLGVVGAQMSLRQHLARLAHRYDVVLIDSPPSLGQLAVLGALAADHLIVPVPTRDKGLLGLKGVLEALRQYRRLRPELDVALYVPTLYDKRRRHDQDTLEYLRATLPNLATEVPYRSTWDDSWRAQQPVGVYAPNGEVHGHVRRVADEIARAVNLEVPARG